MAKVDLKEISLWSRFDKDDSTISSLIILKKYLEQDDFVKGHAISMLDGLVSKVINEQIEMITEAGIKY
jgi:hypothetical protein